MKIIFVLLFATASVFAQFNTLGSWNSQGVPDYLEAQGDEISDALLARVRASLPESQRLPQIHPEYLSSSSQTNIWLTEQADVYVTYVGEGAGYKNVLGFYHYNSGNPPQTINDIASTMTVIFPNVSNSGSGGGLNPGDKVNIGNFPANTVIGWFVAANGYRNGNVTNGHWLLFSDKGLNPESDTTLQQHNVLLNDIGEDRVILAFEDIRRDYGSCDQDFNDAIFYVSATPTNAISYDNISIIEDPENKDRIDLVVSKSADLTEPFDGDEVNFTIELANNGPDTATTVIIADPVPQGLDYVSHMAAAGSYDEESGLWTIDQLLPGESTQLTIKTALNLISISEPAFDMGVAKGFNVFLFNEISQPSADTEGKLAVGQNAYLSSYSVGDKLTTTGGTEDVLVVGKNLTFLSGTVTGGNVVYGKGTNLPIDQVSILHGDLRKDNPINFNAARSHFRSLSRALSRYPANGNVVFENSGLVLTGTDPFLNVFAVSGEELTQATSLNLSAPNGSVALVNINGKTIDWGGALNISGTAKSNVLYNFYRTTSLNIQGISVLGTILAPRGVIEFPSGEINGQVIAKSVYGTGQFNSGDDGENFFVGNIPVSEILVNTALLESVDQYDIDTSNNYSDVTVTIQGFGDPANTGNSNWVQVGEFEGGDLIWVTTEDKDGQLLAGTWGGKISRSTDNGLSWTQLNTGMNVAYIWSLVVDGDDIYAGTERGVYKSTDNGQNWEVTALANIDVRAMAISNTKIYAGTWGQGLYTSTDGGDSWSAISRELTNAAVHALAVNADGDIFAGTYTSGIYRSTNDGSSFEHLDAGYLHIWSMGIDSQGNIFAGTYGGGMYYSNNNGDTFVAYNNNLPATHIYSIRIDPSDDVYITSWNGGVFVLESDARSDQWGPLGMNGLDVSSLWYDETEGALYAATGAGLIYKNDDPLLALEQIDISAPIEFNLAQNYPNPFNPSTRINFSIAEEGHYKLSIFNLLGEELAVLVSEDMTPGNYNYTFNANNLPSGLYIYNLSGNGISLSGKMMLLK
ncbi:MAG: hypothetical protein SCALA702_35610 [Melioribacteraceae bacterium]|nr:MAG: hypothetical protein SCALA702_35610 [Melioribacteraceae bacterium]